MVPVTTHSGSSRSRAYAAGVPGRWTSRAGCRGADAAVPASTTVAPAHRFRGYRHLQRRAPRLGPEYAGFGRCASADRPRHGGRGVPARGRSDGVRHRRTGGHGPGECDPPPGRGLRCLRDMPVASGDAPGRGPCPVVRRALRPRARTSPGETGVENRRDLTSGPRPGRTPFDPAPAHPSGAAPLPYRLERPVCRRQRVRERLRFPTTGAGRPGTGGSRAACCAGRARWRTARSGRRSPGLRPARPGSPAAAPAGNPFRLLWNHHA